jgi:hypothetical protein
MRLLPKTPLPVDVYCYLNPRLITRITGEDEQDRQTNRYQLPFPLRKIFRARSRLQHSSLLRLIQNLSSVVQAKSKLKEKVKETHFERLLAGLERPDPIAGQRLRLAGHPKRIRRQGLLGLLQETDTWLAVSRCFLDDFQLESPLTHCLYC